MQVRLSLTFDAIGVYFGAKVHSHFLHLEVSMLEPSSSKEIAAIRDLQWELSQSDRYYQLARAVLHCEPTPEQVFAYYIDVFGERFRVEWEIAQSPLNRYFAGQKLRHDPTWREAYDYYDTLYGEEFREAWAQALTSLNCHYAGEALHHKPSGKEAYWYLQRITSSRTAA